MSEEVEWKHSQNISKKPRGVNLKENTDGCNYHNYPNRVLYSLGGLF